MLFPVFLQIISALEAIFFVEVNLDKYEEREVKRTRARGRKLIDDLLNMATRLRSGKMGLTLEEIKMIPKIPNDIIFLTLLISSREKARILLKFNKSLVKSKKKKKGPPQNFEDKIFDPYRHEIMSDEEECSICMYTNVDMAKANFCKTAHPGVTICIDCAKKAFLENQSCPICRRPQDKIPGYKEKPQSVLMHISFSKKSGIPVHILKQQMNGDFISLFD